MVHKRYVMKNGVLHGPYLYESYRDKDGKVKKRYLGRGHDHNKGELFSTYLLVLIMFFSFAMLLKMAITTIF